MHLRDRTNTEQKEQTLKKKQKKTINKKKTPKKHTHPVSPITGEAVIIQQAAQHRRDSGKTTLHKPQKWHVTEESISPLGDRVIVLVTYTFLRMASSDLRDWKGFQ